MALVMIVTRDVVDRFNGFLASVMLEVAPNIFVAPRMNKGVRERTWQVVSDWHEQDPRGSLVIVWRDLNGVGGVGINNLGPQSRELLELDGMWLTRRRKSENAL